MVDVAAEERQLRWQRRSARQSPRRDPRRDDGWRAVDQAHQVGTARQAGGSGVEVEPTGDRGRHADGQLDVERSSAGTRPSDAWRRRGGLRGRRAPQQARFEARRTR